VGQSGDAGKQLAQATTWPEINNACINHDGADHDARQQRVKLEGVSTPGVTDEGGEK